MGSKSEEVANLSDDPELEKGRQSGSDRSRSLVSNVLNLKGGTFNLTRVAYLDALNFMR